MNRPYLLMLFAILLGATLMIEPALAFVSANENQLVSCEILQDDPDFLLNITNCNSDLKIDLTFNPTSSKNTLTGWFNITDELNETVFSEHFTIKKNVNPKIPFSLDLREITSKLILKWGLNSSTVSVTSNSVINISSGESNTYQLLFQKTGCTQNDPCGGLSGMSIYGMSFGDLDWQGLNSISLASTSNSLLYSNSTIIESGNARVVALYENKTGNLNSSYGFINTTYLIYGYPKYYQVYDVFSVNTSWRLGGTWSSCVTWGIYKMTATGTNNPRFDEWNNRTINGTNYLYSVDVGTGGDAFISNVSSTVNFLYDDADHNKTILFKTTGYNLTATVTERICQDSSEYVNYALFQENTNDAGTYYFGYLVMFGRNGQTTVANNQTVWNSDFNEQYQAWYNPGTMTAITGTQKGRNNLTGSYNYSANGTLADLNFTTISGMNYTYPTFEIENIYNVSNIVSHVWWKNYTNSSDWIQLTNYSDFVIQDGNSSYFGYNYIVILFNKTFGREGSGTETYEFWISNTTDPSVAGETSPFTRTFNVPSIERLTQQKEISLTKSFNVISTPKNNFLGNPIVQRIMNIVSEPTNNFFKRIELIRVMNSNSKEYMQVNRNIILERTLSAKGNATNTFSGTLVAGLIIVERFFNMVSRETGNFLTLIGLNRFFNVPTEPTNQFNKIILLTKSFNVPTEPTNNFLRNPVVQKLFNINQKDYVTFSKSETTTRLFNIRELTNVSFITALPFEVFERLFNIPFDLLENFLVYIRVWEEVRPYEVCSVLEQIGDSRAYLCVFDTGEWKIFIEGV